jgi:hypothetical protein
LIGYSIVVPFSETEHAAPSVSGRARRGASGREDPRAQREGAEQEMLRGGCTKEYPKNEYFMSSIETSNCAVAGCFVIAMMIEDGAPPRR